MCLCRVKDCGETACPILFVVVVVVGVRTLAVSKCFITFFSILIHKEFHSSKLASDFPKNFV